MKRILIAQKVAGITGMPIKDVERVIVETNKAIIDSVASGENVFLRGFGTYSLKNLKPKIARNFKDKSPMLVPAQQKVSFKPSPVFTEAARDIPVTDDDIKKLFDQNDQAA